MTRIFLRTLGLTAPAALLLLASCSSQPTATDPAKTAVLVPKEENKAADSTAAATAPMGAPADSAAR